MKATREQVLAAYRSNPRAALNPDEAAIDYWMTTGLDNFNTVVDQVRASNPQLAAQIDAERSAAANASGGTDYEAMVRAAYADIGRTGVGSETNQIDPEGLAYWTNRAASEQMTPDQFSDAFSSAVGNYFQQKPQDQYTDYVSDYIVRDAYDDIGRTGIGTAPSNIDQQGYDFWRNQLLTGKVSPDDFDDVFTGAAKNAVLSPTSQTPAGVRQYVVEFLRQGGGNQRRYADLPPAFDASQMQARSPSMGGGMGGTQQDGRGVRTIGGEAAGTPFNLVAPYRSQLIKALRTSSMGAPTPTGGAINLTPNQAAAGGGQDWLNSLSVPTGMSNRPSDQSAPAAPTPTAPPLGPTPAPSGGGGLSGGGMNLDDFSWEGLDIQVPQVGRTPDMNWTDFQSGALVADSGLMDMLAAPSGRGVLFNNAVL
jgi:hypothetical protein